METARNFVGGSLDDARVREEIDVPDPATGELLVRVPVSGPEDVDRAVRAAQEAYQEWSLEPVTRRARRMFRLQVLLEERIDELAEIATRENGKHVEESTAEIRHRGRRARGLDDHADEGRDPRPGKCWGGRRPVRGVSGGPDGVEFYTERKVVIERWQ
jgi:acyl-CoA reductase-like NAD-dependent aldehyde dehydrogenase